MRLLITRPEEDAAPLQVKLAELGHTSVLTPLLAIVPAAGLGFEQKPYQAICVTSANALRAITPPKWMLVLPLLCVGPQSLQQAQAMGFTSASAHGGDVRGLVEHIRRTCSAADGPMLYLAGDQVSADLAGLLASHNFAVEKMVTYAAVPQAPAGFADALKQADGVLLYSPRTAKLYAQLVLDRKLDDAAAKLICFCLSPNVAMQLPRHWTCRVAKQPNEAAMLSLLDRQAQNR